MSTFVSAAALIFMVPIAAAVAQVAPMGAHLEQAPRDRAALQARFSGEQIAILEMLNRADAAHLPRLPELVVPDEWETDPAFYSPFPPTYAWGDAMLKLLVVDQTAQAFAAYASGRLVRWGPVSTGRASSPTPAGLYYLNWRSRGRHSTVDPSWFLEWYYNFHNFRGLSFHEYALPGRPASHACVRLLERDAEWIYHWGESWTLDDGGRTIRQTGTPVLIVGCHRFNQPPPWRSVDWLRTGLALPASPVVSPTECVDPVR